jgi:hypothetical protein
MKKGFRRRDGERAVFGERNAADRDADLNEPVRSGSRVEPVNAAGVDVDPPQHAPDLIPYGPLGQLGVSVQNEFGGNAGKLNRVRHRVLDRTSVGIDTALGLASPAVSEFRT